jgi:electron transport complex protein RnfG
MQGAEAQGMSSRAARSIWPAGLILAILAAVCTALVAVTYRVTAPRIAANEQAYLEQRLKPVLEGIDYQGPLSESTVVIQPPHSLPGSEPVRLYRVFASDKPVAALFIVTPKDGYAGPIRLLIGIAANGSVTGVRVLSHRETAGLGDQIEDGKSDWILQFAGLSLAEPPADEWAIRNDGGAFDQMTGASITSRAVVKAVRDTLVYFGDQHEDIFARTAANE